MGFDSIGKLVPAATLAAFAIAASYAMGHFAYVGLEWTASLTPNDLLALSWKALPFSVLGLGVGYFYSIVAPLRRRGPAEIDQEYTQGNALTKFRIVLSGTFLLSFPIFGTATLLLIPAILSPSWGILSAPISLISGVAFIRSAELYAPEDRVDFARNLALSIVLLGLSYSSGLSSASIRYLIGNNDTLLLNDRNPECVSIVYAAERGVMYINHNSMVSTLIPWNQVRAINRNSCSGISR